MNRPAVAGEGTVRDDAARLKRLPARRSSVDTMPPVARRFRISTTGLIVVTAAALALLVALAPLSVVGDSARAVMYPGMLDAVSVLDIALVIHDGSGSP